MLLCSQIGLLSMIPHLGLSVTCVLGGVVSDQLLRWGLSTTLTRKLMYTIGTVCAFVCPFFQFRRKNITFSPLCQIFQNARARNVTSQATDASHRNAYREACACQGLSIRA